MVGHLKRLDAPELHFLQNSYYAAIDDRKNYNQYGEDKNRALNPAAKAG
jgi:phage anti-repressor protein